MKIPFFGRKQEAESLTYRTLSVRKGPPGREGPSSWNAETRSLQVVAASENAVPVFDWERFEVVPEVLLMDGARLPKSGKIPLLDSHSRGSAADVLGSAQNLHVSGRELLAMVHFSNSTQRAKEAAGLVSEGHLEDFSVGYRVNKSVWIEKGESKTIAGRSFTGPLRVSTDWTPRELSITPIGADETAKARTKQEGRRVMAFWSKNHENQGQGAPPQGAQPGAADELIRAERERIAELTALCNRFDCGHLAQPFIDNGTSVEDAQRAVLQHLSTQRIQQTAAFAPIPAGQIEMGRTAGEKVLPCMAQALAMRAGIPLESPEPGALEYMHFSEKEMGRELLEIQGIRTRGWTWEQVVTRALSMADFPNLMANAQNIVARETWKLAPSAVEPLIKKHTTTNFHEIQRPILSEMDDLLEIPELGEVKYGKLSDSTATYSIATFGRNIAIGRQAIINDSTGKLMDLARGWALRAKAKRDDLVVAAITGNSLMADGIAIFDANHSNVCQTAAAPSISSLTEAQLLLRKQQGLNEAELNLQGKYLLAPPELEVEIDQLINSLGLDDENPAIRNPFYKKFVPIIESRLSSASETAWYLVADPAQIDFLEVAYLNGQETPKVEVQQGWTVLGVETRCYIDLGVGILDFRGAVYNAGAGS